MLLVNYTVKEQRLVPWRGLVPAGDKSPWGLGGSLQEKSSTSLAGGCLVYCLRRTLKSFEINSQIIIRRPGLYWGEMEFLAGGGRIILSRLRSFSLEERKCKQIYIEKRRLYILNMGVQQKALSVITKPYLKLNPWWVKDSQMVRVVLLLTI